MHTVDFIGLVKTGERYMFLYDRQSVDELLRQFGRMARDPELDFNWLDAAILSRRVRRIHGDERDAA